jgi:HD-like signal output (HDOD) protein
MAKEKRNFGVDHCTMGYKLATTWSLPEETCQAVLYHHDFQGLISGGTFIPNVSVQLIALTLVSEWLFTTHTEAGDGPEWAEAGAFALEKLNITQAQLDEFVPQIKDVLAAR